MLNKCDKNALRFKFFKITIYNVKKIYIFMYYIVMLYYMIL